MNGKLESSTDNHRNNQVNDFINNNKDFNDKIKTLLLDQVVEIVKIAKENNNNIGENLRVSIPIDCRDKVKEGILKFMMSKDGNILPDIVDDKNRIIRKIRLKEVPDDIKIDFDRLVIDNKLDLILEKLEYMTELLEGIQSDIKNDRYGVIIGAEATYNQSRIEKDKHFRRGLLVSVQHNINMAIAQIQKSLEEGINYFKEIENSNGIRGLIKGLKYTDKSISKKLHYICLDYYYISRGVNILVKMKRSQKMSDNDILEFLSIRDESARIINESNIRSWLPNKGEKDDWKTEFIINSQNDTEYIDINFNIKDLLERNE